MSLLVVLEHDRGTLAESARQALTAARALGADMGEPVQAVAIGRGAEDIVAEAGHYGAKIVHVVSHVLLVDYGSDAWAESVMQLADDVDAEAVVTTGTDRGNEVMAQIAARADAPFVANCISIEPEDPWLITRIQWGGSLLEDVELEAERKLVTFAYHSVGAEPVAGGAVADFAGRGFGRPLIQILAARQVFDGEL